MKKYGFTLIELMIVVAIIVFLAVLAVPQLFHYKAKAYQAEVAMNLASLHTAQQVYFAQHGNVPPMTQVWQAFNQRMAMLATLATYLEVPSSVQVQMQEETWQ